MKTKIILIILQILALAMGVNLPGFSQVPPGASPLRSSGSMGLVSNVNHTTGSPSIGVPLFDMEHFGIQVQLALSYNTSGIRVEDRAGETGIGWRLTTGGKITRVVRQQPDDLTLTSQIWSMTARQVADVCFKTVATDIYKNYNAANSESDLFYYEIPGKSGMFVLDGQGKPHTIPFQSEISIAVVSGAYFTIKDNSGNLYTFGNTSSSRESTTLVNKNENLNTSKQTEEWIYTSTWHLNSIKNYSGSSITFEYAAGVTETVTSTSYVTTWSNKKPNQATSTDWKSEAKEYPVTTTTGTKVISTITAGPQKIAFTKKANLGNSIGEITYFINNSAVSKYRFSYESFASNRVFLTAIEKGSPANEWQILYSFEYNKTYLLPAYGSYDYDSWGYYNGKNNKTHLPKITNEASDMTNKPIGADKSPALNYAKACILTAIKYDTGGKVEYTYGLNKHGTTDIGGLRVEKIRYLDEKNSEVSSTRYEYANSALGGLAILPRHIYRHNNYDPTNAAPLVVSSTPLYDIYFVSGSPIMYGEITEIAADGSKIMYSYSTPEASPSNIYKDVACIFWHYYSNPKVQATFDVWPDWQPAMVTKPVTSRVWRHGLLLKQTKYDSKGTNIEETIYTYKYDHSKLVTINGYAPCILICAGYEATTFLLEYKWESQPVLLASTETKYFGNTKPSVKTEYTYENNDWVALTSTVQTDAEGNQIKTTHRYAHNLAHTPTSLNFSTKSLVANGILAPVETVTYKNNKVVSSELIEYAFVPLANNSTAVLPQKKYYMPLQSPVASITSANYNSTVNLAYDPRYKLAQTFEYDRWGNVQSIHTPDGDKASYVYMKYNDGSNSNIKIADVTNAVRLTGTSGRVNQVIYNSFEDTYPTTGTVTTTLAKSGQRVYSGSSYSISLADLIPGEYALTYWKSNNSGQSWDKIEENLTISASSSTKSIANNGWIDDVRIIPVDARMKTYTVTPGVGMTSETDHNGVTAYREYDGFGRVIKVLNNERQILEDYQYNIKK